MQVQEVMTEDPVFCTPDTAIQEVARLMVEHDCGALPVMDSGASKRPIGMITDRDITTRLLAEGVNPLKARVKDAMTQAAVGIRASAGIEQAADHMQRNQVRRLMVLSATGSCVGFLTVADLAAVMPAQRLADVMKKITRPTEKASSVVER
jgi:CBS domain-containing protein